MAAPSGGVLSGQIHLDVDRRCYKRLKGKGGGTTTN